MTDARCFTGSEEAANPDGNSVVGLELSGDAAMAREIVTDWLEMFDPPPYIDFQQSEFLQSGIAGAIRRARTLGAAQAAPEPTIDSVPSCGQENDYRRAAQPIPAGDKGEAGGCGATADEIEATIRIEFNHSEDSAGVRRAAERVWTFLEARAKTLARQTTTSVLPCGEGQAAECDGGLRTCDLAYARQQDNDLGILISVLRNFEDAVGENIDDTEGVVAQIEADYLARVVVAQEGSVVSSTNSGDAA